MLKSDFASRTWRQIGGHGAGGSWDDPTLRAPRSGVVIGSNLYCGIYGENLGSAQIWKFDGIEWEIVYSADKQGQPFNRIDAMTVWNNRLVAGVGIWRRPGHAGVLMSDPDGGKIRWEFLPVQLGATEVVDSLAIWQNQLVVGLAAAACNSEAAVVFSDGGPWKTFDLPVKHAGVYCLLNHLGSLYAGTWNRYLGKGGGAGIFKLSAMGWQALAGEGQASAIAATSVMVMTLTSTPNGVYGTYSLVPDRPGWQTPILRLDNDLVAPVPVSDENDVIRTSANFNASIWMEDTFIFASGSSPDHRGGNRLRVWMLNNDGTCTGIGGEQFGGWRDLAIGSANPRNYAWIYKLISFGSSLVAFIAFGNGGGQGEIWMLK